MMGKTINMRSILLLNIMHKSNLETMKNQSWFHKIEHLPQIEMGESNWWSRDGYFCAYKALFANDLLDKIDEDDYIYYTDSSAYFREPFLQNLDRFFDLNGPNIFENYFFDFYFIILSNLSNFSLKSFSAS
jgi:hypothetical protein